MSTTALKRLRLGISIAQLGYLSVVKLTLACAKGASRTSTCSRVAAVCCVSWMGSTSMMGAAKVVRAS